MSRPAELPPLPEGMTRKEAIDGLWETRNMAVEAQKRADPCFNRWPTLDALLVYIETYGFPGIE